MSFKHFFSTHLTESEFKANFKTINESRWWGKFKEDATSLLEYKDQDGKPKKFKVCKMEEDGNGNSPAYVLEARNGARYGLFRATEGKFHCIRMKSGKKHLIKPKGIFKEVDGKLVFELFTFKPSQGKSAARIGGGKELIQKAVQNKKKAFNPEQTLGPVGARVRQGDGMNKPAPNPEPAFDPNATLRELQVLDAPSSWKDAIAQDAEKWAPKPGTVADFSKSSKDPAAIGKMMGGKKHPYKFFVANDGAVYQILTDPITRGVWAVSKTDIDPTPFLKQRDPVQDAKLGEEEQLRVPYSDISAVAQEIADSHEGSDMQYDPKFTDNHIYNYLPDQYHDPKVMAQIHKEVEELLSTLTERRATAEPDKSMPNGEPTFDKNTDEWNRGVYTDAKA
jgi:hypothetical protein